MFDGTKKRQDIKRDFIINLHIYLKRSYESFILRTITVVLSPGLGILLLLYAAFTGVDVVHVSTLSGVGRSIGGDDVNVDKE